MVGEAQWTQSEVIRAVIPWRAACCDRKSSASSANDRRRKAAHLPERCGSAAKGRGREVRLHSASTDYSALSSPSPPFSYSRGYDGVHWRDTPSSLLVPPRHSTIHSSLEGGQQKSAHLTPGSASGSATACRAAAISSSAATPSCSARAAEHVSARNTAAVGILHRDRSCKL